MTTEAKLIKAKMNLLELGSYLGNVSEACRTLGYSRDTFYRLKRKFDEGGIEALREISRRKPIARTVYPKMLNRRLWSWLSSTRLRARSGSQRS